MGNTLSCLLLIRVIMIRIDHRLMSLPAGVATSTIAASSVLAKLMPSASSQDPAAAFWAALSSSLLKTHHPEGGRIRSATSSPSTLRFWESKPYTQGDRVRDRHSSTVVLSCAPLEKVTIGTTHPIRKFAALSIHVLWSTVQSLPSYPCGH